MLATLVEDATAVLQSVVNEVAPGVVDALDVEQIVERVDLNKIVDQVDVQSLIDRVDVQALIDRVDIDALMARVDLDALLERMDVNLLIDRVDISRILVKLDFNVIVTLANGLITQLDLNAVVKRLDIDEIAAQVDVNALLDRVDVDALVERTQLGAIVAQASAGVASEAVDVARSAGVGLDGFVHRWADRLMRRSSSTGPRWTGDARSRERLGRAVTTPTDPDRDLSLQGTYAGIVSRLGGFAIDVFAIAGLFTLAGHVADYIASALLGHSFAVADSPVVTGLALAAWAFFYCAYPLAVSGRTFGMGVVGLQAVAKDGRDLTGRRAVVRVLVFPLSFLLFGFGFILILLNRDRRALHDLIAGSAVVYSWDARAARLRFLARRVPE